MNNEHSRTPDEVQDLRLDCIESDNDALWATIASMQKTIRELVKPDQPADD